MAQPRQYRAPPLRLEDRQQRITRFQNRDSPQNLIKLQQLLASHLCHDAVNELSASNANLLDAVKFRLFDRLLYPERFHLPFTRIQDKEDPLWFFDVKKWTSCTTPYQRQLADDILQQCTFTVFHDGTMGTLGRCNQHRQEFPSTSVQMEGIGCIDWAFVPPDKDGVFFPRGIAYVGSAPFQLLRCYEEEGDEAALAAWIGVLDDWALNFQSCIEASHANIRFYFVQAVYEALFGFLGDLARVAVKRPDFVNRLPSSTLVRVLLVCLVEYPAATIRQCRAGVFNHRVAGTVTLLEFGLLFYDFRIARFSLQEVRKLWESNWVLRTFPDGGPVEWSDIVHESMDQIYLGNAFRRLLITETRHHPGIATWLADPTWRLIERSGRLTHAAYIVRHLKPDGLRYRYCSAAVTSQRDSILGTLDESLAVPFMQRFAREPNWQFTMDFTDASVPNRCGISPGALGCTLRTAPELFNQEPTASIIDAVFGPFQLPRMPLPYPLRPLLSDCLPFKGQAYLRSDWHRSSHHFASFVSRPLPSSNGQKGDNELELHAFGQHLLDMPAITVDGMLQDRYLDLCMMPGSKTELLTHALNASPMPGRVLVSSLSGWFDLVEGDYDGPFCNQRNRPQTALRGFRHVRRLVLIRPLRLWLVVDDLHVPPSDKSHDILLPLHVVAPHYQLEGGGPCPCHVERIQEGDHAAAIHMEAMGLGGVSLFQCALTSAEGSLLAPLPDVKGPLFERYAVTADAWTKRVPKLKRIVTESRGYATTLKTASFASVATWIAPRHAPPILRDFMDGRRKRPFCGRVVERKANSVVLEQIVGGTFERRLNELSPEDRQFIDTWHPQIAQDEFMQWRSSERQGFRCVQDPQQPLQSSSSISGSSSEITQTSLQVREGQATWMASRQPGKAALMTLSPGVQLEAAAVLVVRDAQNRMRGLALDCRSVRIGEVVSAPQDSDFEFCLQPATRALEIVQRIGRPLPLIRILPEHRNAFTSHLQVHFALEGSDPRLSFHYTLNGDDPTPRSPRYDPAVGVHLTATTLVKVRAFMPSACGAALLPTDLSCTEMTMVSQALFTQLETPLPPLAPPSSLQPGLRLHSLVGSWPELFSTHEGEHISPATLTVDQNIAAPADGVLSVQMLQRPPQANRRSLALKVILEGFLRLDHTDLVTFAAPREFMTAVFPPGIECGYELVVEIDGRPWELSYQRHAFGTWTTFLQEGLHRLRVLYCDARNPRKDTWRGFPSDQATWKGDHPTITWSLGGGGGGVQPFVPVPASALFC